MYMNEFVCMLNVAVSVCEHIYESESWVLYDLGHVWYCKHMYIRMLMCKFGSVFVSAGIFECINRYNVHLCMHVSICESESVCLCKQT